MNRKISKIVELSLKNERALHSNLFLPVQFSIVSTESNKDTGRLEGWLVMGSGNVHM
jgi:hypothetical protein